ncbi:MAG: hypothetical protein JRM80_06130 [Nitrososphaerota archaeon]|nr:hypothetical protein [Nitrososphaerota archaeon]
MAQPSVDGRKAGRKPSDRLARYVEELSKLEGECRDSGVPFSDVILRRLTTAIGAPAAKALSYYLDNLSRPAPSFIVGRLEEIFGNGCMVILESLVTPEPKSERKGPGGGQTGGRPAAYGDPRLLGREGLDGPLPLGRFAPGPALSDRGLAPPHLAFRGVSCLGGRAEPSPGSPATFGQPETLLRAHS